MEVLREWCPDSTHPLLKEKDVSFKVVAGIDPSLTGTAVFVGDNDGCAWKRVSSKPGGASPKAREARYMPVIYDVVDVVCDQRPIPKGPRSISERLILIEGYSHGSNQSNKSMSIEFGWSLRRQMLCHGLVIEVPPTTVKKFATGKGNAKKEQMLLHVFKRWGRECLTNDEADAFVLYRIGLCLARMSDPETQQQREVISTIRRSNDMEE